MRAERSVQAILFSLTAITLFSVAKDILDFWDPDPMNKFAPLSPNSIILAVLVLCVAVLSILGVRTIRRE